jgi:hypothetical protein
MPTRRIALAGLATVIATPAAAAAAAPTLSAAERDLAARAAARGREVFVTINNKAEGSAPLSVLRLAEAITAPGPIA